jgi:long-chain fatty acid transport protein
MKYLIFVIYGFLYVSTAHANALDTFGFGSRSEAMAAAQAADAKGWAAAHHNPAGVALADRPEVALGYGGAVMGLQLDGKNAQVTPSRGISFGVALPLKLGSWTVALGFALYMPDQFVVRIQLQPVTEPHFVLLDNNLQHLVVTPVLAIRPARWLAIGAGATILADAAGNGIDFTVGVVNGQKLGAASLDVSLPIRAAPVVGLTVLPRPWLRFGASYRGEIDLNLKLDIVAHVDIAGVITGDTLISLRALNFYTPHKVALGVAADLRPDLTLSAELDWLGWSHFHGAIPDLTVGLNLSISPALLSARFPDARFQDIWVPRLGLEWRRDLRRWLGLAARIGYAFEKSPVPPQTGLTSFADNDRHIVGWGAGLEFRKLHYIHGPIKLDVAMQLHELVYKATSKDPRFDPGGGFNAGGYLLHMSATLEAKF